MFFGSSTQQLSNRIDAMKSAEAALISFANRFKGLYHELDNQRLKSITSQDEATTTDTHSVELFDTKISRNSVPLKKENNECQMTMKTSAWSNNKQEDDHLIIHGVKVTSHVYGDHINYHKQHQNPDYKKHQSNKETPLVILHGYMNGSLYFYRNLLGLSNYSFQGTVYALDLLGWGLSSRPRFLFMKDGKNDHHDDTDFTEQVFVESLEEWRKAHKIDKMTLAGHSIGGYMATAYAERYPKNVDRLILISPAGVPEDKEDMEARFKDAPLRFKLMFGAVTRLWNFGINPSSILRNLPESRGRNLVQNYIEGRLPAITCPQEKKHLGEYLYTNAALPGSGEDCLNKVLKPTTFAIKPIVYRIPQLKVKQVHMIYGQNDWMDSTGGIDTAKLSRDLKNEGKETPDIHVWGVSNAGHLLMLENWSEFNSAMIHANGHGYRLPPNAPIPFSCNVHGPPSENFFTRATWRKRS